MDYLTPEYAKHMLDTYVVPFGINLAIAAAVFIVGKYIARVLSRTIDKVVKKREVEASLRKFVVDLSYAFMLVIVTIVALDCLGVETTAAIAVLGAAGLAVGLALQGSLGNFAAGVMIIILRPYRVGDLITITGHTGCVEAITIFNTILITPDNRQVAVPNGQAIGGPIGKTKPRAVRCGSIWLSVLAILMTSKRRKMSSRRFL